MQEFSSLHIGWDLGQSISQLLLNVYQYSEVLAILLKSEYRYPQSIKDLETRNPDLLKKFQDGFHVIQRTDQFWAGLVGGLDLVIEQMLMRSLKSTGGLTSE